MNIIRSLIATSLCLSVASTAIALESANKSQNANSTLSPSVSYQDDAERDTKDESKLDASSERESADDMEKQLKKMHEMHEKMMNAKTADARTALMSEHMKVMQASMSMMTGMSGGNHKKSESKGMKHCEMVDMTDMEGNEGIEDMEGMKGMKNGMCSDMEAHHNMMEKRMKMMVDRSAS